MTTEELQIIKDKIITELRDLLPDIRVTIHPYNNIVHKTETTTMSGEHYYTNGPRAYVGMTEAAIWVYWDKFFDRICGNGWMYGRDMLFKFDIKDGDCKYYDNPIHITYVVNNWIRTLKSELLQLDIDFKAHKQLEKMINN